MKDLYGIQANVLETDKVFRTGAKCIIEIGTGGTALRYQWRGMSRGGRMVSRWCATHRFHNFRPVWISASVPKHQRFFYYYEGTKKEMNDKAKWLEELAQSERCLRASRHKKASLVKRLMAYFMS